MIYLQYTGHNSIRVGRQRVRHGSIIEVDEDSLNQFNPDLWYVLDDGLQDDDEDNNLEDPIIEVELEEYPNKDWDEPVE